MAIGAPENATAEQLNTNQGQQGNKENKAKLPHIGKFERWVRLTSIPASVATAYYIIHSMSRNGVREFFNDRGWFKAAQTNFSDIDNRKSITASIAKYDKDTSKIMHEKGFKHTWDFFLGNPNQKKVDIVLTAGAAFSIMIGLFAVIADPRNRSAIAHWGIFKKLFNQENQDQQKQDEQKKEAGTDTNAKEQTQSADVPALPDLNPTQNTQASGAMQIRSPQTAPLPNPSLHTATAMTSAPPLTIHP